MNSSLTAEECRAGMKHIAPQIANYADLLVRAGINVQPDQEVVVTAPVEAYEFTRIVVQSAYKAGARHVTVVWSDDQVARTQYLNSPLEFFEHTPAWKRAQLDDLAGEGAAFLWLMGEDPDALAGVDAAKPAAAARARNAECRVYRNGMDFGRNAWCIGGVPVPAWARKVFPGAASDDEAVLKLWQAILSVARSDGDDPIAAWQTHNAAFQKNKRFLNEHSFDALHYTSSNGTDFVIGMNPGHVWKGGSHETVGGVQFFPNIPTEEVFTTPDRMRMDGRVVSALPLVHQGQTVRDFWFEFKDGAVVDFGAAEGADVLKHIINTDENATRLGECALISKSTPIRQSGLLFFNTLYDENASCHLALGTGFPDCLEGGLDMDELQLLEHGVNHSATHVDFMIGADDLCITGIAADGTTTEVFVNGQWAWE